MSTTNIKLLAKELNLSIGTISKALKDSYEISAETKKRVLALAEQLNYSPNFHASSLKRKTSKTIAVVIPEVADSFFSLAIKGIEEIAQTKGYHVLVYLTYESYQKEIRILEEFKNGRVDGVLMSISSETCDYAHIEALDGNNIPVVFFDRVVDEMQTAKVTTDDLYSGYTAAQHLITRGCKRISYLSISSTLGINNKRMEGFRKALHEAGLPFHKSALVQCSNEPQHNYDVLYRIMQQEEKPDGIIASVEKLITPVYLVCKDLQIALPGALKVVCFSNLEAARILSPALTTIAQPAFEMGMAAATILFGALEKRNYKWKLENMILPSRLHIRNSTAG